MAEDDSDLSLIQEFGETYRPDYKPPKPRSALDLEQFLTRFEQPAAMSKAIGSVSEKPDDAAKAIALSKKTGFSPEVVKADYDGTEQKHRTDEAQKYVNSSTHIQDYVNDYPLGAQVSNDDFDGLNELSKKLNSRREGGLLQTVPQFFRIMQTSEGREKYLNALKNYPAEFVKGIVETLGVPGDVAGGKIDLSTEEGLDQAINLASFIGFGRLSKLPATGKTSGMGKPDLTPRTKEMLDKGEVPPFGVDPLVDELHVAQHKVDSAAFENIMTAADATKTLERSKDAIAAFIRLRESGSVEIPAEAVAKLYDQAGKSPHGEDGLLGHIPDLADQLRVGMASGVDIKVPIADYVAHTDRAVHEKLKDFIRYREEGATREEIQLASEAAKEESVKAEKARPEEAKTEVFKPEPGEKIKSAAIKIGDEIFEGTTHGEAAIKAEEKLGKEIDSSIESDLTGFMTTSGRYLSREQALIVAQEAGQFAADRTDWAMMKAGYDPKYLTQEDLSFEAKQMMNAALSDEQSLYLQPIYKTAKDLGVTGMEFKRYSEKIAKQHEELFDRVLATAKRLTAKRQTAEWKKAEAEVRNTVVEEYKDRPDIAADNLTRNGEFPNGNKYPEPMKLKRDTVEQVVGKDNNIKELTAEDGINPDYVASLLEIDSGAEMIKLLEEYNKGRKNQGVGPKTYLARVIDKEVDARMNERFGLLPENIMQEARAIATGEFKVDLLASEVRMLAEQANVKPAFTREMLADAVERNFGNQKMSSLRDWQALRRAVEKGGRDAERFLLAGKFEDAMKAKQRQLLAFLGLREANAFAKEQARIERLFERFTEQDTVTGVSQEYTNQIQALLGRLGYDISREPGSLTESLKGVSFEQFINQKNAEGGLIPYFEPPPVNTWKSFTVDQFRDLGTMVKSLNHAGREAESIRIGAEKMAYEEGIGQALKNLDTMEKKGFDPGQKGLIGSVKRGLRWMDAKLLKAEQLLDWIDHDDPNGPMNRMVYRALSEGELKKADMVTKLAEQVKKIPVDRAWGRSLQDKVPNRTLYDLDGMELHPINRENMITMALNWGNKSNRDVLLRGRNWKEADVQKLLDDNMTKMDWDFVQGVWRLFDNLAPEIQAVTERRSGVPIKMVEPIEMKTQFGDFKGGYYPLIEDPKSKLLKAKTPHDLFDRHSFNPLPVAHALKSRTGATYPLDLTFTSLHGRINETVHALFMQEAVANAYKVLNDDLIRTGIANAFGPEYVRELDTWIRDVAQNGGMKDGLIENWVSASLRENVTTMLMGYKVSTAAIHGMSALSTSLYEVGPLRFAKEVQKLGLGQFLPDAARRMFSNPDKIFETVDFVYKNSPEIRNRQRGISRDFGHQMDKLVKENVGDDLSAARRANLVWAMTLVGYVDQLSTAPVWMAKYKMALTEGVSHADAVYQADKAVRQAHGSASLVNRANVGRGEVNRWLTIAYNGYWNHNYNRFRDASRRVADSNVEVSDRLIKGSAAATAIIVVPAIIHYMIRGSDNESVPGAMAEGLISQFAGQVPIVNSLLYAILHERDPSVSPFDALMKGIKDTVVDSHHKIQGRRARHFVKHVAQTPGWLFGLGPTNQLGQTAEFLKETFEGTQRPRSVFDWARGLITGDVLPPRHRRRH